MAGRPKSKRGNGEGSIYQRADGIWCAAVSPQGTKRRVLYGKTRQEVAKKLTDALRASATGMPQPGQQLTVGKFLSRWLTDSVEPSVRPKTYSSYEQLVRVHITPELGRISLARLSPEDVQRFMNRKLQSGLSPRTVQYLRAVLRRALNQAVKWGLVVRNVATLVDAPRSKRHEILPFRPEEARTFLASIRGDRLEALYSVALAVGLRQGEALGARWDDLDQTSGTLHIRRALQRINGALTFVEPKTERSRRAIALPAFAITALRDHRVRQLEERLLCGDRWIENGLIFTSTIGTPLEPTNVTRRFQAALEKAGLAKRRFHDLRHACATLLLAQGVSARVVMETLGHSQISLTMNTYSHVIPEMQRDAAARLDDLLAAAL